jgi:hypothetical protein
MKIRFNAPIKTEATLDICCFSGQCRRQIWEFDAGEELEVKNIIWGEYRKTKTRPGLKGGRFRHCDLILVGKNEDTLHPDTLTGVPESVFEVINEI